MYNSSAHYLTADQKISEVVLNYPPIMLLLEHFNISVPFQEKTILEICRDRNLNPEVLLTFANLYRGYSYSTPVHFTFTEIKPIVGFLKNNHAYYIHEMFPHIRSIIKQMYEVNHQREMVLVEKFFQEYFNEVTEHLDYEDKVVFPYTESLLEHIEKQKPVDKPYSYSVDVYKDHHNNIEEKLTDLKNLLVKYLPLNNDQQIRRSLFFSLTELEHDLNVHAKIEDMILIPLVEKMELHLNNLK